MEKTPLAFSGYEPERIAGGIRESQLRIHDRYSAVLVQIQ